ncbi:transposase [Streptomyces sp. MMS24-I2-30]|uniref:transposase n=1 Tax=Streptomyces sp. MMS24-I2-30 TaxID=3351564 RepID=UPI0038968F09
MTDRQWAQLEPLLPMGKKAGRPRTWTRRQLIDGIRWRTRAGTPWRDVPEDTARGTGSTTCSADGSATAPGSGSWSNCRSRPTRRV